MKGRLYFLVHDRSLYDVWLCADETGSMMSESAILVGGGCAGTDLSDVSQIGNVR